MKKITYSDIYRRKYSLSNNTNDDEKLESLVETLIYNKDLDPTKVNDSAINKVYVELANLCSKSSKLANRYVDDILKAAINEKSNNLLNIVNDKLIPIIYESGLYAADSFGIESISETVDMIRSIDRILENNEKLFSAIDIDSLLESTTNSELVTYKICEAVDKFNGSIADKVLVTLETLEYIKGYNKTDYIYEDVISYFLLSKPELGDISDLKTKIESSYFIERYIDNESVAPINNFKLSFKKDKDLLINTIHSVIKDSSQVNFTVCVTELLRLMKEILISSEDDKLVNSIFDEAIPELYLSILKKYEDSNMFKIIISNAIYSIEFAISNNKLFIEKFNSENIANRFTRYIVSLESVLDKLNDLNNMTYLPSNYKVMEESVSLNQIAYAAANKVKDIGDNITDKVGGAIKSAFKRPDHNLIKAVVGIDRLIANKFASIKNKSITALNKIKNKIFNENTDISVYITENGIFDYTISIYESDYIDNTIMEVSTEICEAINNTELYKSPYKLYFTATNNYLEFHLFSQETYTVTEEYDFYMTEEDIDYAANIQSISEAFTYDNISTDNLINVFKEYNDKELFESFVEIASIAGIARDELYTIALESDIDYDINKYNVLEEVSIDEQLEALNTIGYFIEAANNKQDTSWTNRLNNLKLIFKGMGQKLKRADAKFNSTMRNAEATVNHFANSIQQALNTDRREAIIKGSVMPSFKKAIALFIPIAGLVISGNWIVAVIGSLGAFACSKHLNNKERQLILDDIEVELEVLDKEISTAESNGKMKKLRALLTTKKNLERQYQRIKYNIRIGKDVIPSSSAGVYKNQ